MSCPPFAGSSNGLPTEAERVRSLRSSPFARARAAGFTLIEAIVAMVVMATCLLALYSWLSSSTLALSRAEAQVHSIEMSRSALALIESVNPLEEPRGERSSNALTVRWQANPLTERRPGVSSVGFPTQFDFILYEMEVEVSWDGERVRAFSFRKAGWEATRPINLDDE